MNDQRDEFKYPKLTEEEQENMYGISREANGFFSEGEDSFYGKQADLHRKQYADNMTKEETFHFILGAVSGGLIIAGVFIFVFFLFLLFATKVWLK